MDILVSILCAFSVGHLFREILRLKSQIYAFESYSTITCAALVYMYLRNEDHYLTFLCILFGLSALFTWTKGVFTDDRNRNFIRAAELSHMRYLQTLELKNIEILHLKAEIARLKSDKTISETKELNLDSKSQV